MPNFKIVGEREYSTTDNNEDNNFYTSSIATCLVIYGENENGGAKFAHLLSANYVTNDGVIKNEPLSYLNDYNSKKHVYCNKEYKDSNSTKTLLAYFEENNYESIIEESADCVFYLGEYNSKKLDAPGNIPKYNVSNEVMRLSPNEDEELNFVW